MKSPLTYFGLAVLAISIGMMWVSATGSHKALAQAAIVATKTQGTCVYQTMRSRHLEDYARARIKILATAPDPVLRKLAALDTDNLKWTLAHEQATTCP